MNAFSIIEVAFPNLDPRYFACLPGVLQMFPLEEIDLSKSQLTYDDQSWDMMDIVPDKLVPSFAGKRIPYTELEIKVRCSALATTYVFKQVIGKGGFATVYLAHYEGQKVAVKELLAKRENAQEDMEATQQFRSEV